MATAIDERLILGLVLGIFGSMFLNVGKGVQKQKVQVLKQGRKMFSAAHRKDFLIWLLGILMTIAAAGFYSASLKFTDRSSLVSSLSGIGLVGLLLYAWLVLKESIGFREIFSSALIILGTGMVSYFNESLGHEQKHQLSHFIYVSLFLGAVFGVMAYAGAKVPKFWGLACRELDRPGHDPGGYGAGPERGQHAPAIPEPLCVSGIVCLDLSPGAYAGRIF